MEEVLESLSELSRSLIRIYNKTPLSVLKCDLDRLDKAKELLNKYSPPFDEEQMLFTSYKTTEE